MGIQLSFIKLIRHKISGAQLGHQVAVEGDFVDVIQDVSRAIRSAWRVDRVDLNEDESRVAQR